MGRPRKKITIGKFPTCRGFVPATSLPEKGTFILLALDEYEAIRLSDIEGLPIKTAAAQLGISPATLCRTLKRGRKKIAYAIFKGEEFFICKGDLNPSMEKRI